MPTDSIQNNIQLGDIVNVPCKVTGTGGTTSQPTVTLETKYRGFDGLVDTVTTLDAIQVIKDK